MTRTYLPPQEEGAPPPREAAEAAAAMVAAEEGEEGAAAAARLGVAVATRQRTAAMGQMEALQQTTLALEWAASWRKKSCAAAHVLS